MRFQLQDSDVALARLRSAGVRFGRAEVQDDQAYAPRNWDYGQPRLGVTFARLRTTSDKHLFTVKRPVTDVRTCIEHECWVSDRDAMHEAILLMEFVPTIRILKKRRMAQFGDWTICLDDVQGLGRFIEIERLAGADDDTDAARVEMEDFLRDIDIEAQRCFDTYDALLVAVGGAADRHESRATAAA